MPKGRFSQPWMHCNAYETEAMQQQLEAHEL